MISAGPKEQAIRGGAAIGEFIREQREQAQVSLRQLARLAGVSNPYLSQIERGLRKPSADILQQIAKGLRISAEQLYVRAGILEAHDGDPEVVAAILADTVLTERQKQVLVEIYQSFRREAINTQSGGHPCRSPLTSAATPTPPSSRAKAVTATSATRRHRRRAGQQAVGQAQANVAQLTAPVAGGAVTDLRSQAEKTLNVEAIRSAVEPYLAQARIYRSSVTERAEGLLDSVKESVTSDKRVARVVTTAESVTGLVVDTVTERVVKPVTSLTGRKPAASTRRTSASKHGRRQGAGEEGREAGRHPSGREEDGHQEHGHQEHGHQERTRRQERGQEVARQEEHRVGRLTLPPVVRVSRGHVLATHGQLVSGARPGRGISGATLPTVITLGECPSSTSCTTTRTGSCSSVCWRCRCGRSSTA